MRNPNWPAIFLSVAVLVQPLLPSTAYEHSLKSAESAARPFRSPFTDNSESPTAAGRPPPSSVDLDDFYSADVKKVAAFLGPEMHFHHGLQSAEVNELLGRGADALPVPGDESLAERALADALRVLYPHIPLGASVLDVGCGWCGPATLLAEERAALVRGVTIARAQAEFCRARRDVPTLHADVEEIDTTQMLRMAPSREAGEAPQGVLLSGFTSAAYPAIANPPSPSRETRL